MAIKLTPKANDEESLTEEEVKINTMNEIATKIQNVKKINNNLYSKFFLFHIIMIAN